MLCKQVDESRSVVYSELTTLLNTSGAFSVSCGVRDSVLFNLCMYVFCSQYGWRVCTYVSALLTITLKATAHEARVAGTLKGAISVETSGVFIAMRAQLTLIHICRK